MGMLWGIFFSLLALIMCFVQELGLENNIYVEHVRLNDKWD